MLPSQAKALGNQNRDGGVRGDLVLAPAAAPVVVMVDDARLNNTNVNVRHVRTLASCTS